MFNIIPNAALRSDLKRYIELVLPNPAVEDARRTASKLTDFRAVAALIPQMRPVIYETDHPWVLDLLEKDVDAQAVEYALCSKDRVHWCHNHVMLHGWDRKLKRFEYNSAQWYLHVHRAPHTLVVKARRQGVSTHYLLSEDLYDALFDTNIQAVLMAHLKTETKKLFRRAKIALKHLPSYLKPKMAEDTQYGLIFKESAVGVPLESSFFCATAGTQESGRGNDADRLHCTEFSSFPNPAETMASIEESGRDDQWVVIESTADPSKEGGREFQAHVDLVKMGASEYRLHFFPWWCSERNRVKSSEFPDLVVSPEIKMLAEAHDLDEDQQKWIELKRKKLRWRARWEHPATIDEAFAVGESPYYHVDVITSLAARAELIKAGKHPDIRLLQWQHGDPGWFNQSIYNEYEERIGGVYVYERPKKGWQYRAGADCAEGVERDESALVILDAVTKRQVCVAHSSRWDEWVFAQMIWQITWHYGAGNHAVCPVLIERNNQGSGVIQNLRRMIAQGSELERQRSEIFLASVGLPNAEKEPRKIGVETSDQMRHFIYAQSLPWVNNEWIDLIDYFTIQQARAIFYDTKRKNPRPDHPKNGHDDIFFATLLASLLAFDPRYAWQPDPEQTVEYKNALERLVAEHDRRVEEESEETVEGRFEDAFVDEHADALMGGGAIE